MNPQARDQRLEDVHMEGVMLRLRQMAVEEVARRGTTFTALRESVEVLYGRPCNTHGIDGHEYRVRFTEWDNQPDIGPVAMAHDYVLDLSRPDTTRIEISPFPADPKVAELLSCL